MSTNEERNAHFQISAQQVAYKILDLIPDSLHTYSRDDQKLVVEIIAQYAYDLVEHALQYMPCMEQIPDLTKWPEYCYSCQVEPRQSGSILCPTCQQERDDELQDHYDSHYQ